MLTYLHLAILLLFRAISGYSFEKAKTYEKRNHYFLNGSSQSLTVFKAKWLNIWKSILGIQDWSNITTSSLMVSLQSLLGVCHAVSLGLFALYDAFHSPI